MAFGDSYIENVREIWMLTEPPLKRFSKTEGLYETFRGQYGRARTLSNENSCFFREQIAPILNAPDPLPEAQRQKLFDFAAALVTLEQMELVDRMLCMKLYERLLRDARFRNDLRDEAHCLYELIQLDYHMTLVTSRSHDPDSIIMTDHFAQEGLHYASYTERFLPMAVFATLPGEVQDDVMACVRMRSLFYTEDSGTEGFCTRVRLARETIGLALDEGRRVAAPTINWVRYTDMCRYYLAVCSEFAAESELDKGSALFNSIYQALDEVEAVLKSGVEYNFASLDTLQVMRTRLDHYTGRITTREFLKPMLEQYETRDISDHSAAGIYYNLLVAAMISEYIVPDLDRDPSLQGQLKMIYRNILQYALSMPNNDCQELFLNYTLSLLCLSFRELPGGVTYAELSDRLMANCSPSTYVHVQMVGRIAQTLADHLIETHPELFLGLCDCRTVQQVQLRQKRLSHLIYQYGLYHDVGKLPFLDTIGVTYRSFFPEELRIVQLHPRAGYEMLKRYPSTREFAQTALRHHQWFDGTKGYPLDETLPEDPHPLITHIIAVADCMDAATDTIFRAYNPGISLQKFIAEADEGAGTRYDPVVTELLHDPHLLKQLDQLFATEREEAYLCAYKLYRSQLRETGLVQETAEESKVENHAVQPEPDDVSATFERLFEKLEGSDDAIEEFRQFVLHHISDLTVLNVYLPRFDELMRRKGSVYGQAVSCVMSFWRIYSTDMDEAVRQNEEGMRLIHAVPNFASTPGYQSLINNAVLACTIRKDYSEAYRYAATGLQEISSRPMKDPTFYCALLNNTSLILADVGLMKKALRQLEESMTFIDQQAPKNAAATKYLYAQFKARVGDYATSQALFLELLANAEQLHLHEPWQILPHLVLLAYHRQDGVTLNYWLDELEKSLEGVPPEACGIEYYTILYARAVCHTARGEYEQTDEIYTLILQHLDEMLVDQTSLLREMIAFYDSYGRTERSHPLLQKLDELHRNAMDLVDTITTVDSEMMQQNASRRASAQLFSRMKRIAALNQELTGCMSHGEIVKLLLRDLPGILALDGLLLLVRQEDGDWSVLPAEDGSSRMVPAKDPALLPFMARTSPRILRLAEARCPLFPPELLSDEGAMISVPLCCQSDTLGHLFIYSRQATSFEEGSRELLASMSTGIGIALQNIARYDRAVRQARMDPLTGIANRAGFMTGTAERVEKGGEYALLMIDIDDFKGVNDTFGHTIGDVVLKRLAEILTDTRKDALAGRYGGEEFVVLTPLAPGEALGELGETLRRITGGTQFFPEQRAPITISVGVSRWHRDRELSAIIKEADDRLYQAKRTGKNTVCTDEKDEQAI